MKSGTKTLIFGVHQFIWHPLTVVLAWMDLYHEIPNWKTLVCIFIHDFGYFGLSDIDGEEGSHHPLFAGRFAHKYLDAPGSFYGDDGTYSALCLYHSRFTARNLGHKPSKLCWADKLSCKYDPWWLYLPRAILSGEIIEYRKNAADFGACPISFSNLQWYKWAQPRMIGKAYHRDDRPSYQEGS